MSDIKKINGKYYDFAPKNQSFLLTAKELQAVGIKNYYFMLEVRNPRIAGIDPFKLTPADKGTMALLIQEYRTNIWSFIRDAVRLRTDAGVVPFGLHRGLAAAIWCFWHSQDFCLCEPRQTWKTSGILGSCMLWAYQFQQNLNIHFFGKEGENTKRNLNILKSDIEELPPWLQFRVYSDDNGKIKKARASTEILKNDFNHNSVTIHAKPTSAQHAEGMGRGASTAVEYFDEIEHTPFFRYIWANNTPAFMTAAANARSINAIACRAASCTPGNLGSSIGAEVKPFMDAMIPWTERIYDMTEQERREYMDAFHSYHEENVQSNTSGAMASIDVFYIEYQYFQVRKDYAWVQEQYRKSGDREAVIREILLKRMRSSDKTPFDLDTIEALISNCKKSTDDLIINHKWRYRLYNHGQPTRHDNYNNDILDPNIPYLVGVDPSSGEGGDNFAVVVVNPYTLQVAAEFKSEYIGVNDALDMLTSLVVNYIPKAVMCVERNSIGAWLIQQLVDRGIIKQNLYWSEKSAQKQLDMLSSQDPSMTSLKEAMSQYHKYGTFVSASVRKSMMELLYAIVTEHADLVTSEYLVDDICKLERYPNGKIAAAKGAHDDIVMAYLHALYIYANGDNLTTFGIIPNQELIFGEDLEENIIEVDEQGWFSTEHIVPFSREHDIQLMIQEDERDKYLAQKFPNYIKDPKYPHPERIGHNDYDDTTDIPAYFFDMLNGGMM